MDSAIESIYEVLKIPYCHIAVEKCLIGKRFVPYYYEVCVDVHVQWLLLGLSSESAIESIYEVLNTPYCHPLKQNCTVENCLMIDMMCTSYDELCVDVHVLTAALWTI